MNLIILTTGLSGSSVVTGLIKRAGYWTGEATVYKNNSSGKYETNENTRLVELNDQLVNEAGFEFGHDAWYNPGALGQFSKLHENINNNSYRQFIEQENTHSPWLWKDPRLWLTLGYWIKWLNLENTRFIVLSRNPYNLWASQVEKRAIYDYGYLKRSESDSRKNLVSFLQKHHCQYLSLEFDELVHQPGQQINRLNEFLGTSLDMNDWQATYKKPDSFKMLKRNLLAVPIYLKNYAERIR